MSRFLVRAEGPDARGVVAAVTGVIAKRGANLEDTSTTRLGGHFVMLMVSSIAEDVTADEFRALFAPVTSTFLLDVAVEALPDDSQPSRLAGGELWAITVSGPDRPGIVSAVSESLAEIGANIEELSTRIVGASTAAYAVLIDVAVPKEVSAQQLTDEMSGLASRLGVSIDVRPVNQR